MKPISAGICNLSLLCGKRRGMSSCCMPTIIRLADAATTAWSITVGTEFAPKLDEIDEFVCSNCPWRQIGPVANDEGTFPEFERYYILLPPVEAPGLDEIYFHSNKLVTAPSLMPVYFEGF